jgi:hypothetical protein
VRGAVGRDSAVIVALFVQRIAAKPEGVGLGFAGDLVVGDDAFAGGLPRGGLRAVVPASVDIARGQRRASRDKRSDNQEKAAQHSRNAPAHGFWSPRATCGSLWEGIRGTVKHHP